MQRWHRSHLWAALTLWSLMGVLGPWRSFNMPRYVFSFNILMTQIWLLHWATITCEQHESTYWYMSVRQVFAEIQVVLFTCLWWNLTETETAESAPCSYSTFFCCYYDYTQIKETLWSFKRYLILICTIRSYRVFLVLFTVKHKDRPHRCGLQPQRGKQSVSQTSKRHL